MGRGSYLGGSTILWPWSVWFSRPQPSKPIKKSSSKGKANTKKKKVGKARATISKFEEEAARRAAGGAVSSSGRVVMRDDDAGLVIERKGGKTRRILFPVSE